MAAAAAETSASGTGTTRERVAVHGDRNTVIYTGDRNTVIINPPAKKHKGGRPTRAQSLAAAAQTRGQRTLAFSSGSLLLDRVGEQVLPQVCVLGVVRHTALTPRSV